MRLQKIQSRWTLITRWPARHFILQVRFLQFVRLQKKSSQRVCMANMYTHAAVAADIMEVAAVDAMVMKEDVMDMTVTVVADATTRAVAAVTKILR